MVGNVEEGGHTLACQGITFVSPDGDTCFLDTNCNIAEENQLVFPLLIVWAPLFEETTDWL